MVVKTQKIYAALEEGVDVKVMAEDWTPDYEGLTEAVLQEIDLYALAENEDYTRNKSVRLGTATFDTDADRLRSSDVELDLDDDVLAEYSV